jgi:membrane-bound serine protease (ClpP class)
MVGLADYTELLLFAIGCVLLAVEIFVLPGFGIAGFSGIAVLMVAMVLSLQSFVLPRPEFPWEMKTLIRNMIYASASLVGAVLIILLFFRYAFPKLGTMVNGPYLGADLRDAHVENTLEQTLKIGDRGIAYSALRPSGKAQFDERLIDVVAESMFIEKGETVVINEIAGNRIVVTRETT